MNGQTQKPAKYSVFLSNRITPLPTTKNKLQALVFPDPEKFHPVAS
jgi:hypothetical protein